MTVRHEGIDSSEGMPIAMAATGVQNVRGKSGPHLMLCNFIKLGPLGGRALQVACKLSLILAWPVAGRGTQEPFSCSPNGLQQMGIDVLVAVVHFSRT